MEVLFGIFAIVWIIFSIPEGFNTPWGALKLIVGILGIIAILFIMVVHPVGVYR